MAAVISHPPLDNIIRVLYHSNGLRARDVERPCAVSFAYTASHDNTSGSRGYAFSWTTQTWAELQQRSARFSMNREYHHWFSPALRREMELLVFGSGGTRVLVFPTSMGRFYQWEDFGMLDPLRSRLEAGALQLFCVDSVDAESWYDTSRPPDARVQRHVEYDQYLTDEALPFIAAHNPNPALTTVGASFGAYHAVNFAFRHPEHVTRVLGMSGLYDVRRFADGATSDELYFNNPIEYIAHEHDPERLAALRRLDTILAIGRDDPSCGSNQALSDELWGKDIWHALRIWDGWAHDWPYWKQMIARYIDGHD